MKFNPDNIKNTKFVDDRYDYTDFPVTDENFNEHATYECERGHNLGYVEAKPMLLRDSAVYDPRDGRFSLSGVVVYVCMLCENPVSEAEE